MAIPSGFPTAETTGVPAGTVLTTYTGPMTITTDGTVIDGKIINGSLVIEADNVIIRNCKITYDSWWGVSAGGKNIVIQDCDITGPGYGGDSNSSIVGNGTFLRNDISQSENGILLDGNSSIVKWNYIHDLQDSGSAHYDGIEIHGNVNGALIEDNTIISRDTSNVFIKNNFGPISNITINHNYMAGVAGYNIYVDGRASGGPITGVTITNNYLEKGVYGYYSIDNSSPTISGNIEYLSGQSPPSDQDAPIITSNGGGSSASVSIQENTTTVTTVAATDADSAGLTYSISGGADAAKFKINATTGALAFVAAPNFEAPTDVGGNNVYDVQVRASDGSLTDTQSIAVTVTNRYETAAPAFTDANDTVMLPSAGGTFDALGGDDQLFYRGGWVTIDGGPGSDTIDFSQFGSAVRQEAEASLGSNGSELWALVSDSWQAIGTLTSVGRFVGTSYGDVLQGTINDNPIAGAVGNTLTGRGGNDTFVFGEASGHDTITDFDDWGNDVIEVSTSVFANFAALEHALKDVGRDVLIELDSHNSMTLRDTSFASVTESDFLFV
jgi:hypothetical protein